VVSHHGDHGVDGGEVVEPRPQAGVVDEEVVSGALQLELPIGLLDAIARRSQFRQDLPDRRVLGGIQPHRPGRAMEQLDHLADPLPGEAVGLGGR